MTACPTFSHEVTSISPGVSTEFRFDRARSGRDQSLRCSRRDPPAEEQDWGTAAARQISLLSTRFAARNDASVGHRGTQDYQPVKRFDRHKRKSSACGLQPGTGSTDFFIAANWTYTGLFNLRRLVADEDFHSLIRSEGTQKTRLGSTFESRFWLSYRPYESKDVTREWFIGPALTWLHSQDDRIAGVTQHGSGGDVLLTGSHDIRGSSSGHAYLGGCRLGRCAFDRSDVHAGSPPH